MDAHGAGGGRPLLFLSHAGADTEAARLKRRLEDAPDARAAGLRVWFDKDDLRPDEMALHRGQDSLALLEAEARRRRGTAARRALAGADLVHLPRPVRPGQFQYHPPPHRAPGTHPPARDITPLGSGRFLGSAQARNV